MSAIRTKLEGKVAIITGGASGIGEATVRLFAKHSPLALVIADIQDELGRKVAESIGSNICSYYHCDVSDEGQVKAMVEWTVQRYGQLDIMFANAGIMSSLNQTLLDLDLSEMDRIFSINVRGVAACVKHAARVMVERQIRGSIVITASVAGSRGFMKATDYYMSKHAILGLMRCACRQLGVHGIRVNCVSPNAIPTRLALESFNMDQEKIDKVFQHFISLKGISLTVNHVADAVLFLASDDSAFITGHDLLIDGGFTG